MRFCSLSLVVAWVAVVGTGCSASPAIESQGQPAYCQNALQTCFEFCLCATGEADRCFDACDDSAGVGGAAGSPAASGGNAGTAGSTSGGAGGAAGASTGGEPGTGGAPSGGAPSGGGGGAGGVPAGTGGAPSGPSCVGHCGSSQPVAGSCFCDGQCQQYGDCCSDYAAACAGGSGGATGSGGAPSGSSCGAWPSGTPGVATNSTLPQSLSWQGFRENSSTSATVSIQDYYDCDGSKGIHAVMLITGQPNCGACKSEAATLEAKMGTWAGMGIKVVTLMIGSVSTAQTWKSKYGLNKSAVLADKMPPALAYSSTIGTPMHHIVDPRTMKVIHTQMGAGGSAFSKLEQLAAANKK